MVTQVSELTGFDVYRDGGSISLSFKDLNSDEWCLFFGINLVSRGIGEIESLGYKSPVLEQYIRNDYTSPVTGVTSKDWKKETTPISWDESSDIISQLEPQFDMFESDYKWVFGQMKSVAENFGVKPADS